MFLTHPTFKHRVQLDQEVTLWTSIEFALHAPWYLATIQDPHEPLQRTVAIGTNDVLLLFSEAAPWGKLVALQLVMPPRHLSEDWQVLSIAAVARLNDTGRLPPMAVVITHDSVHYGGVPLKRISPLASQLTPLVCFERSNTHSQ